MNKVVILNSPCLPKKSYHCGNAVSQIISEILFSFFSKFDNTSEFYYVDDSWNLHGLPFEKMYYDQYGIVGNYKEIKEFAEKHIQYAKEEKNFFSTIKQDYCIINHSDTDDDFVNYTVELFRSFCKSNYIKKNAENYSLDLSTVLADKQISNISDINIFPIYHAKTIINDFGMIHGNYTLTKDRIFSPSIKIDNMTYVINPIFQSFIYPLYITKKYNIDYPVFAQISSSGHGMLKWHYLRNIISHLLSQNVPYKNLILHGNVLGNDGKRMSKYSNNAIQPSNLHEIMPDKRFVRHVLIKSISDNDLQLQTQTSFSEFNKIKNKLDFLQSTNFCVNNEVLLNIFLNKIKDNLKSFKIKKSFDLLYLVLRKLIFQPINVNMTKNATEFKNICEIFYGSK